MRNLIPINGKAVTEFGTIRYAIAVVIAITWINGVVALMKVCL